jgi:glycosyltransferase involved in cell wall biosynthesis
MIHTDVLYSRYGLFTPLELIVLSVKSSALEINAELANFYKKRNWLLHTIYLLQRQIIKRAVKLFIHVTKESLDKSAEPRNSVFVTNGIDLTRFIQLPRLNTEDQKINLIFVGSADFPWNGFEKLELIANSLPNIEITTVGINSSSHPRIKSLPSLYANDLQDLFILMDAAISTLDIQIMGIVEAAPLKTRHYLASGLPVIGGYIDSAYPNGADFYFKINFSTDTTRILNLDEMNRFLNRWKMRRVNAFNLAEIDIRMTEKTRLQYLRRIMQT